MKCYLNELIRPGQNAFIKGRHIEDNIRLLSDVIDLTAANEIPGSILLQIFVKSSIHLIGIICFASWQIIALDQLFSNG